MKKIFLITLLFIMLFCSSCRKNNSDPIAHTDKLERNEQVLENNQPENNISVNEQTGDEHVNENNETTQENQSEPVIEKAEFYPYTVDDYFRPYEVIVTLTTEETSKNLEYTPEDFKGLDILSVSEFFEFTYSPFNFDYIGDFNSGRKSIILLLKNPSKQTVIDYVDYLKNDERVYFASPSLFYPHFSGHGFVPDSPDDIASKAYLSVTFDEKHSKKLYDKYYKNGASSFEKEDFSEFEKIKAYVTNPTYYAIHTNSPEKITVIFTVGELSAEQMYTDYVVKAHQIEGVASARMVYGTLNIDDLAVTISSERIKLDKEYTIEEFEGVLASSIMPNINPGISTRVYFEFDKNNKNHFVLSRTIGALYNNPIVEHIYIGSNSVIPEDASYYIK